VAFLSWLSFTEREDECLLSLARVLPDKESRRSIWPQGLQELEVCGNGWYLCFNMMFKFIFRLTIFFSLLRKAQKEEEELDESDLLEDHFSVDKD
jgi:hypothetical protein